MRGTSGPLMATKEHVTFCFDVLSGHFTGQDVQPSFEDALCPLFVTWNKTVHRGQARLRGCIGTLEPRLLHKALKDYALTSALHDRRFPPMAVDELTLLHCTVSFLHSFETASDWLDWTIRVHGLIINFKEPGTRCQRSATFLPEVAAHEGWSQMQTMESLIRKAGYHGSARSVLKTLEVTRYQSSASSMTYSEYFATRHQQVGAHAPDPSLAITVPA